MGMSSHHVPIIFLSGNAGSGKDTCGSYLAGGFNGICVAQADPMKRFAAEVFGFDENTLWGDTAARNVVHDWTVVNKLAINMAFERYMTNGGELNRVLPEGKSATAYRRLRYWFESMYHNLENDIPLSARLVLQTLGTEWGRKVDREMWSRYAIENCRKLLSGENIYSKTEGLKEAPDCKGYDFTIITDGRFRNEAINARMAGGVALRIDRPDTGSAAATASAGVANHVSEKELNGIPHHFYNQVVNNDGDLIDLAGKLDGIMRYYYGV